MLTLIELKHERLYVQKVGTVMYTNLYIAISITVANFGQDFRAQVGNKLKFACKFGWGDNIEIKFCNHS